MADNKSALPTGAPTELLLKRFTEAEKSREKYDSTWERNLRLYKSKAWEGIEKIAWFQSEPQYNLTFEFVEIMRGYLADNKWGLDVIPAGVPAELQTALDAANKPDGEDALAPTAAAVGGKDPAREINALCSKVNRLLDFLWMDTRMQGKLAACLMHVFLKGTGIIKSVFDPDNVTASGIGQIETTVVDPFYFYPDPDATCIQDAAFLIEKHPVSVRWVVDRYPDRADEFLKSIGASSMDAAPSGDRAYGSVNTEEGKRVDILECWYKDSAVWDSDQEGENAPKKGDKKYPNGRYTVMSDKGIELEDKPSEYDVFPYVRFVEIPMPGEFWGGCTIDKAADLQLVINQLLRAIIDNGLWMVHGIWIADDVSGVTPETLSGYGPRDTIIKRVGSDVRRDVGEPLPHTIFQTYQDTVQAIRAVFGVPDILRGIAPSRQPVVTTQLQMESGEVRTRERSRRVEEALEDLGKLWLGIVSKMWVDKRTIRSKNSVAGFDMFQMSREDLADWRFDIFVRPGSTTPLDLATAFDRAKSMRLEMQMPIPDEFFAQLAQIPGLEASMLQAQQDAQAAAQQPFDPAELAGMEAPPDEQGEGDQFPAPEDGLEGDLPQDPTQLP